MSSSNYSENACGVIDVNNSPTYLFNNLTCNGNLAFFLKGCKLISFQEAALSGSIPADGKSSSLKDMIDGTQVQWCLIGSRYHLVCTSYSGVQVYGSDGKTVEYVFPLKSSDIDFGSEPEGSYFTRGICAVNATNQICVGASTGHIFIFNVTDEDEIDLKNTKACHKYAVSAMCNVENILATGDDYGNIILWDVFENYDELCRFQGSSHPCTGLIGQNGYVIGTYTSGHIRVFSIRNEQLFIEIAGHSRPITGIDIHPAHDSFVTVGEDSILNVWQFPKQDDEEDSNTGGDIHKARSLKVIFSTSSPNALFTGVQYAKNGTNTIFTSVYDQNEIRK